MRYWLIAVVFGITLGCQREKAPTEKYFSGEPVAHWLKEVQSADPKVRKHAVEVLGNVGASNPDAFPALIAALKDRDASVRNAAVLALSKNGPAASQALPALEEATRDPDANVRNNAIKAVERVRGQSN